MSGGALPLPPRNIKIVIEYDGAGYVGWERQKNGLGIQEVIEGAIRKITREATTVNGSGRTDAGVHAWGQVANFTLQSRMGTDDLRRALNAVLPEDVAILVLEEVSLYFHARFSATSKVYRYRVLNDRTRAPLARHTCYQVFAPLDVEAMRAAAAHLVGRHDFSAFCREAHLVDSCVRHLMRCDVVREGRFIRFDLEADGFLYNMVRIIVGSLIHVGSGKLQPDRIPAILASGERIQAGPTVPSHGLGLLGVSYDGGSADERDSVG